MGVQMGAAIFSKYTDLLEHVAHRFGFTVPAEARRSVLIASVAAGFAAIFGTPVSSAVFSVEVLQLGKLTAGRDLLPAFVGAIVADFTCRHFNELINFEGHGHYPCESCRSGSMSFVNDLGELVCVVIAACAFGLTARAFEALLHTFKDGFKKISDKFVQKFPCVTKDSTLVTPFFGGTVVILLWLVLSIFATTSHLNISPDYDGTDPKSYVFAEPYLGLTVDSPGFNLGSLFKQREATFWPHVFALKLIFTTLTIAGGFKGGEVTPLFVIGAALGNTMALILGQDAQLFSALGFVAVFAGCANTPLACTLMGIELFGSAKAFHFFVACYIAFLTSNFDEPNTIYNQQLLDMHDKRAHTSHPFGKLSFFKRELQSTASSE